MQKTLKRFDRRMARYQSFMENSARWVGRVGNLNASELYLHYCVKLLELTVRHPRLPEDVFCGCVVRAFENVIIDMSLPRLAYLDPNWEDTVPRRPVNRKRVASGRLIAI